MTDYVAEAETVRGRALRAVEMVDYVLGLEGEMAEVASVYNLYQTGEVVSPFVVGYLDSTRDPMDTENEEAGPLLDCRSNLERSRDHMRGRAI